MVEMGLAIDIAHKKWLDWGYILNLEQSGFANGCVVTCEKEKTE